MENRFEKFSTLTSRIRRTIRKIKTEEMAEFDLKTTHLSCIYLLYKKGPLTAKELSELCEEDKGALSRSIEQLECYSLIKREDAIQKKYKTLLTLTENGTRIAEKLVLKIEEILESTAIGVSDSDREIFYKTLSTISDNLEKICQKYN